MCTSERRMTKPFQSYPSQCRKGTRYCSHKSNLHTHVTNERKCKGITQTAMGIGRGMQKKKGGGDIHITQTRPFINSCFFVHSVRGAIVN